MKDDILKEVRNFADGAHGVQMRKYTAERYIVHPERVMEICRQYTRDTEVLAAALLHDVLEDTPVEQEEMLSFLREVMDGGMARRTLDLVVELTDVYEKKYYPQWNRAKRKSMETERLTKVSSEAQTIKYADIIDNAKEIVVYDPGFRKVFLRECRSLLENMKKGNAELRKEAMELVSGAMREPGSINI